MVWLLSYYSLARSVLQHPHHYPPCSILCSHNPTAKSFFMQNHEEVCKPFVKQSTVKSAREQKQGTGKSHVYGVPKVQRGHGSSIAPCLHSLSRTVPRIHSFKVSFVGDAFQHVKIINFLFLFLRAVKSCSASPGPLWSSISSQLFIHGESI